MTNKTDTSIYEFIYKGPKVIPEICKINVHHNYIVNTFGVLVIFASMTMCLSALTTSLHFSLSFLYLVITTAKFFPEI